ncbi:unnamed protein product [Symbiodinium natans]|uniref:Uncharacterized protein n=1 Tax=Symbiodinium natans TaxID=878477 RepID=A0A812M865_9DINO|nr:unnamed protein product [Symbiodinium natans]
MGEPGPESGLWLTKGGLEAWWLMECNIELAKQGFFKQIQNGLDCELAEAKYLDFDVAKRMDGGFPGDNVKRSIKEFNMLLGMTMGIQRHLYMFHVGNSKFAPERAMSETKVAIQQVLDTLGSHWRRALANNLQRDQGLELLERLAGIQEHVAGEGCSFHYLPASRKAKRCRATPNGS